MADKSKQRAKKQRALNGGIYQAGLPSGRRGGPDTDELGLRCDECGRTLTKDPWMAMAFVGFARRYADNAIVEPEVARRFYICHKNVCDVRLRQLPINAGHADNWWDLTEMVDDDWPTTRDTLRTRFKWHPEARARMERVFTEVERARARGWRLPPNPYATRYSAKQRSAIGANVTFETTVLHLVELIKLGEGGGSDATGDGSFPIDDFLNRVGPVGEAVERTVAELESSVLRKLLVLARSGRTGRDVFEVERAYRRMSAEEMREAIGGAGLSGLAPGLARARESSVNLEARQWTRGGWREMVVLCDYETPARAGADGMLQVISLTEDDVDVTRLVDQATLFPSLEDLRLHLVEVTGEAIELEESE